MADDSLFQMDTMTRTASSAISGARLPVAELVSVLAVIGAFGLSVGYTYPAVALNLEARGVSPVVIGLRPKNVSSSPAAVLR